MNLETESDWQGWIGRETRAIDMVSADLAHRFAATFAGQVADMPIPPCLFWCLCPPVFTPDQLGRDGHPAPGQILPKLPLPRRMWAGGEIRFHGDLAIGDRVMRTSTIERIEEKSGSTGQLWFVAVRHRYAVDSEERIDERHDIVYRADPEKGAPARTPPFAERLDDLLAELRPETSSTLLFRYSALTFNGHRIHYDHPYATEIEGYDGLVVHGPMQATWMANLAARHLGRTPSRMRYRGLSPLICGEPVVVELAEAGQGHYSARVRIDGGPATMSADIWP